MTFPEWLEQKYIQWEHTQSGRQSYYNFARYLDVNHTSVAQWVSGTSQPGGDDLAKIAGKLGDEVYNLLGIVPTPGQTHGLASSLALLPAALRERFVNAANETAQQISARSLDPESAEAKILAVKVFDKWGFHISG
jgi:hypothetical protein